MANKGYVPDFTKSKGAYSNMWINPKTGKYELGTWTDGKLVSSKPIEPPADSDNDVLTKSMK